MSASAPVDYPRPDRLQVPVRGGELAVARWGHGDPVALALHGVTANHLAWARVAGELGDGATLLAPDLRGRGDSRELPGPHGLAAHAADAIAVLDHVGAATAVVAGHSMGGWVAALTAVLSPGRVRSLLLVDGGIPLPLDLPDEPDVDAVLGSVIGPAMDRLSTTFPSREAYREFWRRHPAFAGAWGPAVEAYADHDLVEVADGWRSRVALEAVRADSADNLLNPASRDAIERVTRPALFLWAPRGMLDQEGGLYPEERVRTYVERIASLRAESVPDTNHYTIVMGQRGAATVAAHLRAATR